MVEAMKEARTTSGPSWSDRLVSAAAALLLLAVWVAGACVTNLSELPLP